MSEDLALALKRLADESRPVRQTDLSALSDMPRSQTALFAAVWDQFSPARRLELAQALVEQAEQNIHLNFFSILRELLTATDAQVRKLAIEGLWEDNRPNLVAPLVRLVSDDPGPDVRAAAAISLGRFVKLGSLGEINEAQAEHAEQALRAAWSRPHEVTEVRRRALEGLAYSDGADVREMISAAYLDEDDLLRQSAIYAMGRSADPRWARYVLAEFRSREVSMRFEAAVAAGELGLQAAIAPLVNLLEDHDGTVREAAATALGQIGGPAARRALQAAASGQDEDLVEAAQAALDEISFNIGGLGQALFDITPPVAGDAQSADEDELEPARARPRGSPDLFEPGDGFDESLDDDEIVAYDEDEVDWLAEDEAGAEFGADFEDDDNEDEDDEEDDDDESW